MGYRKIINLHKDARAVLEQERCYALEKIHGTSAHIAWTREGGFTYFPGGIKMETFRAMLDKRFPNLEGNILKEICFNHNSVVFYGEAYGGKCQKMSDIYGPLNFIVFEVKINDKWLNVPFCDVWCKDTNLPFVYWEEGPATVEWLNLQRDRPSEQAKRNGMGDDKIGEGIVIRALDESSEDRFGNRIIAKHKRAEFSETKTPREIDPEKQKIYAQAKETAEEFVVMQRMYHVIDSLVSKNPSFEFSMKSTRTVIGAMVGDVRKEEGDSIEWSKAIQTAIGNRAAVLWRKYLEERISEDI